MSNEQLAMSNVKKAKKVTVTKEFFMNKKHFFTAMSVCLLAFSLAAFSACSGSTGTGELDKAIREVSNYLNENIPKGNKVVIVNIQSDYIALSEYIIEGLVVNAAKDNVFSVVEMSGVALLRTESNYPISGEVDDASAVKLGMVFGAQTVISGRVSKTDGAYRLTIRALETATAQVQGMFNRTIASIDKKLLSDSKAPVTADLTYTDNDGNYQGTYKGEVFDLQGVPHGKGTRVYASGDVYEGDWVNGTPHGNGKYSWTDGDVYEGGWVNGKRSGKGKWSFSNGNIFEGDFVDGLPNGKGKYTYADGYVQEGIWKDGKFVQ